MGKRAGSTIVLRKGLENLSYEIMAIQSKYVRAMQDTVEEFSTRFPENLDFFQVEVEDNDPYTIHSES